MRSTCSVIKIQAEKRMKKFQYKAAAAVLVLLLLSVSGVYWLSVKSPTKPALDGSFQTLSIDVNGLRRNYSLYVPARISQQAPLVIVLHGSKGDGQQARKVYSFLFDQLADEHGFIVVYPDGYERHWNGCRTDGPYAANRLAIDDVGFLQTLQQRIRKTYGLDSGKTLFTGLSNGGHMVLRMALERPDSAAVYVPVIANMPAATNMGCNEAKESVAIAFMNGTLDPLNPYEGGEVALYGHFLPGGKCFLQRIQWPIG